MGSKTSSSIVDYCVAEFSVAENVELDFVTQVLHDMFDPGGGSVALCLSLAEGYLLVVAVFVAGVFVSTEGALVLVHYRNKFGAGQSEGPSPNDLKSLWNIPYGVTVDLPAVSNL